MTGLRIHENAPIRRRTPYGVLPSILLVAYLGTAIANPESRPESGPVAETAAAAVLLRALPRAAEAKLALPVTADAVEGVASWYGAELHGLPTASGEPFDMHGLTAAHRTLPLGTRARVTNLENGRSVLVRINDRGPHVRRRLIDLSYGAARELDMLAAGSARVEVAPLGP
jgi:rare lipoprotein A